MIANHPQIVIIRNINLFLPLLFSPFLISTLSSRRAFHCSERWGWGRYRTECPYRVPCPFQ